jgi:hypothetical protein
MQSRENYVKAIDLLEDYAADSISSPWVHSLLRSPLLNGDGG